MFIPFATVEGTALAIVELTQYQYRPTELFGIVSRMDPADVAPWIDQVHDDYEQPYHSSDSWLI